MDEFVDELGENTKVLIIKKVFKKTSHKTRTWMTPEQANKISFNLFDYVVSNDEQSLNFPHDLFPKTRFKFFKELPIMEHLDNIMELLEKEKFIVLSASTGSGKSTQVPAKIALENHQARILVISPTVNSCESLKRRVQSEYPYLKIGSAAGGRIHYDENSQIVFATAGHVENMLFTNKGFRKHFTHIVLDEAHTVSAEYETIANLVQEFKLPIDIYFIISSATVYKEIIEPWEILIGHPIKKYELEVPIYPIEETFEECMPETEKELLENMIDYLKEQNTEQPEGHFLVFCSGEETINNLYRSITEDDEHFKNCTCFCAYASQPFEENDTSFQQTIPLKDDFRRSIILATNIAETSITIPGVVLVVDSGKQKIVTIGQNDVVQLITIDVSAFAAKQRGGRTGRTGPGEVHRMYTQYHKDQLVQTYTPELQRTPLNEIILKFLSFEISPLRVLCKISETKEEIPPIGKQVLNETIVLKTIQKLTSIGLLIGNRKPTEEAMAICSMPMRLMLRRCFYQLQSQKKTLSQGNYLICVLAIVITEIESSNQTLTYYRRRRHDESDEDFGKWISKQTKAFERFEADAICPLNICITMYIRYATEIARTTEGLFAATKKWAMENCMNSKSIMDVNALLLRLDGFKVTDFSSSISNNYIKQAFQNHAIPMFLKQHPNQQNHFFDPSGDGKWINEMEQSSTYSRLSNHGFGKNFHLQDTNRVLALVISEIRTGQGKVLSFLSIYVPLDRMMMAIDIELIHSSDSD